MATAQVVQEQRIVLCHVRWVTYERLLADHENSSVPRFTYDRGALEIMRPPLRHERYKRLIEQLLSTAAVELGVEMYSLGSTTFRRADLDRGFEADSCFYIQNEASVRGKDRIDARTDPPPDLVVEIEITHASIPKLPIYAQFGVPEVWRYDGERLEVLVFEGAEYVASTHSHAIPAITAQAVTGLLAEGDALGSSAWLRRVRAWARDLGDEGEAHA
jgi:Uma2 family endonuclease